MTPDTVDPLAAVPSVPENVIDAGAVLASRSKAHQASVPKQGVGLQRLDGSLSDLAEHAPKIPPLVSI
jgi:hypothetical protein